MKLIKIIQTILQRRKMVDDNSIVNYCYKMLRILTKRYCIKFPQYLFDKDELESHLLVTIANVVNRNRKKPLNKKWKRYCKTAIQMGIREFLLKQRKKAMLEKRIRNNFEIQKNSISQLL